MELYWIEPGSTIPTERGDVLIVIPIHGGHDHFVGCLSSVLSKTSPDVPILIADDASPDRRSERFVRDLESSGTTEHKLFYLRRATNVGFPANVNAALAACHPADVVILNSDCVVAEGWLDGLREAAHTDSTVATATALTNHGSLVSVPTRGRPTHLPQDWDVDRAAAAIRSASLRIRPRLPTAIGHCVYIRRAAVELVGDFDVAFSPGYGEEVDFSQRCLRAGLCHVLADDVFVLHFGAGSFTASAERTRHDHEQIIDARYPYYAEVVHACEADAIGPLARSLSAARRALKGLTVMIDARVLAGATTGTQLHVAALIGALARTGEVGLAAIVPDHPSGDALRALSSIENLDLLTRAQAEHDHRTRADVIHRPYQVNHDGDLAFLTRLADRVVVTNHDLIAFHNPFYFSDFDDWAGYRQVTRSALGTVDRAIFVSQHARDQAVSEELIEPHRTSVIHNGVDHIMSSERPTPLPPRGHDELPDSAPAILCVGTDFHHKNRVFAIRVLYELQRLFDWQGVLLLVGPRVAHGSSVPQETELLALTPRLARAVHSFPAVSEAEKEWLYERATIVLYSTVDEGFGLVPFESADHDVPCMWAPGSALSEVLPDDAAEIVAWDAAETAQRANQLLGDPAARQRNLSSIRQAAQPFTWDAAASSLLRVYKETCDGSVSPAGQLGRRTVHGYLSQDAVRLVGPGGLLPSDVERPLLALAAHRGIGAPTFAALKAGYRAGHKLKRFNRDPRSGRL